MFTLILALLLAAVVWLLWLVRAHQRRLTELAESIRQRRPYLVDAPAGPFAARWRELAGAVNDLLGSLQSSDTERSGQSSQIEATLENLQEGVMVVDDANRIILVNKSLSQIFPDAPVALGQRIETVAHSSSFSAFLDGIRQGGGESRVDIEFAGKTTPIFVEATGTLIPSWKQNGAKWVLCVLHDVSRQKQLENMRKDFVANVSHELRTPLSVIKGYIETLVDDHAELPPADRDRFLRTIQRHTDRLQSILEDLLTLSRLESKKPGLTLEPTDLSRLIRQLADDYRQRLQTSGHELRLDLPADPIAVPLDASRITQVLENLVDNAMKYTPSHSVIRIEARTTAAEVEVRVADNGPGIPAHDLPRIFERFYRVDKGRSREKGGTGLGLSIVKHIVQLHGGRIGAESEAGQGTTITFTLPLAARLTFGND